MVVVSDFMVNGLGSEKKMMVMGSRGDLGVILSRCVFDF